CGTLIGVILPVGLDDGHFHLPATQCGQVEGGAVRRLDSTSNVVLCAASVDQPADGSSPRGVQAGDRPCSNSDEALLLRWGGNGGNHGSDPGCQGECGTQGSGFHQS